MDKNHGGIIFSERLSVEQLEEGKELSPKFDKKGLIPVATTAYDSGEMLMHAYMNKEAMAQTLITGEAHYWSRSRQVLWRKGEISGLVQKVIQLRIDDDQDALWLRVRILDQASCHVGYRSCFYRMIEIDKNNTPKLIFVETEKLFDAKKVYAGLGSPTRL